MNVISTLTQPYPPASKMFDTSCPRQQSLLLAKNTTVYGVDEPHAPHVLPSDTEVFHDEDACSQEWVLMNVMALLAIVLDLLGCTLSWRMMKTAVRADAGLGGLGGLAGGLAGGGIGGGPGPDGGPAGPEPPA